MSGYPWIYWLVVLIVGVAVSTVLMGIGYLLGQKIAARRVAAVREEIECNRLKRTENPLDRLTRTYSGGV